MKQYLLDTNICIYFLNDQFGIKDKMVEVGIAHCFISEITLAELKFGAENSSSKANNRQRIEQFASQLGLIPIFGVLDLYAKEKARLRKKGTPVDDFDLLIGATAVHHNLIMVSRNAKHFSRIKGIQLENWVPEGS